MLDFLAEYYVLMLVVVIAAISYFFGIKFIKQLIDRMNEKMVGRAKLIVYSAVPPAVFFICIWLLNLFLYLWDVEKLIPEIPVQEIVMKLGAMGFPIALSWFLLRLIFRLEKVLGADSRMRANLHLLTKVVQVSIVFVTVMIVIDRLGFNINSFLAFGGVGGIAVGFAAKDTIANFFGSLILSIDRPFDVGDSIFSPDRNIEGTVWEIGWRFTRIITPERVHICVPNALFTSVIICNRSHASRRRVRFTVRIGYEDGTVDPSSLVSAIQDDIKKHDGVVESDSMVNILLLGSNLIDVDVLIISTRTGYRDFLSHRQDAMVSIARVVSLMGCKVVFPASIVELNMNAEY